MLCSWDGMNFVKSSSDAPVEANILEILFVDGHRGCPSLDQRLLLLKVVGSKPLLFAKPEQDILCSVANFSIARHTSSWVIIFLLYNTLFPNPTPLIIVGILGRFNRGFVVYIPNLAPKIII